MVRDFFKPSDLDPVRAGVAEGVDNLVNRLYEAGKIKGTFTDNSIPMGFTEQTIGDYYDISSYRKLELQYNGPQIVHPPKGLGSFFVSIYSVNEAI